MEKEKEFQTYAAGLKLVRFQTSPEVLCAEHVCKCVRVCFLLNLNVCNQGLG